jgi:3-hydroxyacyl-CoA dehydrogenase/3a,7a,12a-trihydroxy-5b-cholest-24-enoyl-CoA hydratase
MEGIRDSWNKVNQFETNSTYPEDGSSMSAIVMENISNMTAKKEAAEAAKAAASAPAQAAPTGGAASDLKAAQIFGMMGAHLAEGNGAAIIKKVGAVFNFDVILKKGGKPVATWELDLKNGNGFVKLGKCAKPDATFTMTDADFDALCNGKLNPQNAFMTGKMKIKGNLAKATKFTPDLFPAPTPENIAAYKAKL